MLKGDIFQEIFRMFGQDELFIFSEDIHRNQI